MLETGTMLLLERPERWTLLDRNYHCLRQARLKLRRLWASRWLSGNYRSEEHTSELQSRPHLVCRLLLEKKKKSNRAVSFVCQAQGALSIAGAPASVQY